MTTDYCLGSLQQLVASCVPRFCTRRSCFQSCSDAINEYCFVQLAAASSGFQMLVCIDLDLNCQPSPVCWLRCIYGNKQSACKTKQSDVGVMPAVCPEPQTAQLFTFRAGMTNASIVGTSSMCFKWCRVESGWSKSPTEVLLVAVLERVTNQPKCVLRTCRN